MRGRCFLSSHLSFPIITATIIIAEKPLFYKNYIFFKKTLDKQIC